MKKTLEYYMGLPYVIEVIPVPEEDGGGYVTRLPEVGRKAIIADGETIDAALANLEKIKKERFSDYLEKGITIPEPKGDQEDYSGRFLVRIPKTLHAELSKAAEEEGISLNSYVVHLLSKRSIAEHIAKKIEVIMSELLSMRKSMWTISHYHIKSEKINLEIKTQGKKLNELTKGTFANAA